MPAISSYASKATPVAADKIVGTDSADGSTKNFLLSALGVGLTPGSIAIANASGLLTSDANLTWVAATGLHIGTGDDYYTDAFPLGAWLRHGQFAAPLTGKGPSVKIARVESIANTVFASSANQYNGAIVAVSNSLLATQVQAEAINGAAIGGGSTAGADLCGIQGTGWASNVGANSWAIGGTFQGRRDVTTSRTHGAEIGVYNNTASPGTFAAAGPSSDVGIWLTSQGQGAGSACSVGMEVWASASTPFQYGVHFTTASVTQGGIIDDSNAVTSYIVNGSRTYGLDTKGGTFSGAPIRLGNAQSIAARNAADGADVSLISLNASNQIVLGTQIAPGLGVATAGTANAGLIVGVLIGTGTVSALSCNTTLQPSVGSNAEWVSVGGSIGTNPGNMNSAYGVRINAISKSGGNSVNAASYGLSVTQPTASATATNNYIAQYIGPGAAEADIQFADEVLTLSTSGTTTDTTANLLPANSEILSVDTRITTTIATATNWSVGDPTTATRFSSSNSTLTAGTNQVGLNHKDGGVAAGAGAKQAAAAKVRITTTGTPSAGVVHIVVKYIKHVAPSS